MPRTYSSHRSIRIPAVLTALVLIAAAATPNPVFGPGVRSALARSAAPVILPSWLPPPDGPYKRLYASAVVANGGYIVRIDPVPDCRGADACSFIAIAAFPIPHGRVDAARRIRLESGREANYTPIRCGASCGPESLLWDERGYRYSITIRDADLETIVRVANSMVPVGEH